MLYLTHSPGPPLAPFVEQLLAAHGRTDTP